jgi:RHS repeat-associated protein
VDEPDSSNNLGSIDTPAQPTAYTYSALDKLIQIDQTPQTRTFGYSSLGRLTSATNPESGTVSYQYDNSGNLTSKTDARSVTTTYTYDALDRNLTVRYSDATPGVDRFWDGATLGKGKPWKSQTLGANGTLVTVPSYDALGRAPTQHQQFWTGGAWSANYTVSRTYNLAGAVTEQTYPSLRTVNYTYDAAGDLEKFTGNLGTGGSPRTYADFIDYNAQGQMLYEQFGTNTVLHHNLHYNARGQLFDVRLGTQNGSRSTHVVNWGNATWDRGAIRTFFNSDLTDYTATPTWANNNGNVWRQDHFAPITTDVSQWAMAIAYYNYDTLNRVTGIWENKAGHATAETAVYTQQFLYDRWGNRRVNTAVSNVPGVPMAAMDVDTATNRLTVPAGQTGTITYDAAGNQTSDNWTMGALGGGARTYDAENRMTSAVSGAGTSSYSYDADGRRVRRVAANGISSQTWWQIYGLGGELVAEYELVSGTPTLRKEYGYRNGQPLVVADASTVQWTVTDALGTPRMVVDQTGSLGGMKRHDYLPFGEEVLANVGLRETTMGYTAYAGTQSIRQQFTGKERDVETGLDYFLARYYSSYQGRFTSPDEFTGGPDELYDFADDASDNPTFYADLFEPQSLNKYQYCYNQPLTYVDLDGHKGLRERLAQAAQSAGDFVVGVGRGIGASLSYGTWDAANPKSSDSVASRAGQVVGTALVGGTGTSSALGGGAVLLGTGGAGAVFVAPEVAVVAGVYAAGGAAKNGVALATTPMQMGSTGQKSSGLSTQKKERSVEGAQDQLEGITAAKQKKQKRGYKKPGQKKQRDIESTNKSEDNLDYQLERYRQEYNQQQIPQAPPKPQTPPKPPTKIPDGTQ